jgi:hypothetical protein
MGTFGPAVKMVAMGPQFGPHFGISHRGFLIGDSLIFFAIWG